MNRTLEAPYTMTAGAYVETLSPEEREKNYDTHDWDYEEFFRCVTCDCRPGGVWSKMPCGIGGAGLPSYVAPWQ